ncbi:hypothetical protein C2857_000627 [Epichloe festucae Fl1]|uniref:2EXR domain-containing protein n=1 Tax=Epichloe festucae (strain Fl1) TaxID=877507 RepID=A0A7U3SN31_EPIFF|nr:hypothetical protein C2857_000627 [Epichloe festucae Fl1]
MEPTFHPFPRLPFELRARIWVLTVEPRTVPVTCWIGHRRANEVNRYPDFYNWRVDLNIEAMKPGLLAKHFASTLPLSRSLALDLKLYEKLILEPGSTASYAWVNFDMDTIDIGENELYERFIHCANKIRRLKFKASIRSEEWFCFESQNLSHFNNLLECFVVTEHNIFDWAGAKFYRPRCNPEGVFIIQEQTGQMKCLADLDQCQ